MKDGITPEFLFEIKFRIYKILAVANAGGIVVALGILGAFTTTPQISFVWISFPVMSFLFGLIFAGVSLIAELVGILQWASKPESGKNPDKFLLLMKKDEVYLVIVTVISGAAFFIGVGGGLINLYLALNPGPQPMPPFMLPSGGS